MVKINAVSWFVLYLLIMQESIAGNTTIGYRNLIYIELCFLLQIKTETMYCEPKIFTFLTSSLQESLLLEFIMMLMIIFFWEGGILIILILYRKLPQKIIP